MADHLCPMCRGRELQHKFTYDAPSPGEIVFDFMRGVPYRRELKSCRWCRHVVEWIEQDQSALYSGGDYVTATYGDKEGLKRAFDKIVALPPEKSDNTGRVRYVLEFMRRRLASSQGNTMQPKILDVGSGLGVFLHAMKKAGWRCRAVDMDQRQVDHLNQVVGVHAILGDAVLAQGLGQFNLVSFNKVLEHVANPVELLSGVACLLETDGVVYVELPDAEGAEKEGFHREEFFLGHIHVFSFASFSHLAMRAGYRMISLERLREPSGKYTLRGFMAISA
ncbi:MAG: class I SAM-dependent methyltransferase [Magnetococcales bacterium]|nr:class I SAM-dependent methyltransferase [Magnetococcales bacterium]MBF0321483.1 class I SAM-dependent methyltransferase [Magnetococcales bacterium]